MKIELIKVNGSKEVSFAKLTHAGVDTGMHVSQDIARFGRHNGETDPNAIFTELNAHWARRSEMDQQAILKLYQAALRCRSTYLDRSYMESVSLNRKTTRLDVVRDFLKSLRPIVNDLLALHDVQALTSFLRNTYLFPDIIQMFREQPAADDDIVRTYYRQDYHELMALTLALRSVLPIFMMARATINGTKAFDGWMIKHTVSRLSPLVKSPAYQKLHGFVSATVQYAKNTETVTPKEVEEVMAQILITRLANVNIIACTAPHGASAVSYIYSYIVQSVRTDGFRKRA